MGQNADMTVGPAEDFTTLHENVLSFLGAFSATQFAIDGMVGMYLRAQMPDLGAELDKTFLRRIRDDQRLPLFEAFAKNVKYAYDVPLFVTLYIRAKQVRDMVGHAQWVGGPVSPSGTVGVATTVTEANRTLVPNRLYPSTFTHLKADCEWLCMHIYRAGFVGNATKFVTAGGQPHEPQIPPARPAGGEPLGQAGANHVSRLRRRARDR